MARKQLLNASRHSYNKTNTLAESGVTGETISAATGLETLSRVHCSSYLHNEHLGGTSQALIKIWPLLH